MKRLLHPGEAEAIALAVEIAADTDNYLLVLDDSQARRYAEAQKLRLMGTVGLLTQAKLSGLIAEIKPLLEELKRQEFHVNAELIAQALIKAGES